MKSKILLLILVFSSVYAFAQRRPDQFTEETSPTNENFEVYSQKNGQVRRASLLNLKKYFTPEVETTAINYVPAATGNTTNLMEFVKTAGDSIYYIDAAGASFLLHDPAAGGGSTELADGVTIIGDGTAGNPFKIDTVNQIATKHDLTGLGGGGGGSTNANVIGYPVDSFFVQDFESNISGVNAFNGGVISHDGSSLVITNNDGGHSRGANVGGSLTEGKEYYLYVDITLPTGLSQVSFSDEWHNTPDFLIINESGKYYEKFTCLADGNGDERIVIHGGEGLTPPFSYNINEIGIYEVLDETVIPIRADIEVFDKRVRQLENNQYCQDFSIDDDGVTYTGWTPNTSTLDLSNGKLEFINIPIRTISFLDGEFAEKTIIDISFDFEYVDTDVTVYPVWGSNNYITQPKVLSSSGHYSFRFAKDGNAAAEFNGVIFRNSATGSYSLDNVCIEERSFELLNYGGNIEIGDQITTVAGTGSEANEFNISIGNNLQNSIDNSLISVGHDMKFDFPGLLKTGLVTGESVLVGDETWAAHARNTGIGYEQILLGQSNYSLGTGNENWVTHGGTIGSRAYLNTYPTNLDLLSNDRHGNSLVFSEGNIFFANGAHHRTPEGRISRGTSLPNTEDVILHGRDAHDGRYPAWESTENYTRNSSSKNADRVFYQDSIWYALLDNLNSPPSINNSNWAFFKTDSEGAAAEFNIAGGHIYLASGVGTGNQDGGNSGLMISNQDGTKTGNEKNDLTIALEVRSDSSLTAGTYLYLLDAATGTLKRVELGDPDSAGTGFRTLRVAN